MIADSKTHIFPIGVVAKILNISVPTIRLYEKEGVVLIRKTESGRRVFSEADIERLKCLRRVITEEGVNIQGIKKLLAMLPCWKLNPQCSADDYKQCPAYTEISGPCWSLPEKPDICKNADCYDCPVYNAPVDCGKIKKFLHPED
jgi:MerR family transcriptional regulator/heat shock protein HspR